MKHCGDFEYEGRNLVKMQVCENEKLIRVSLQFNVLLIPCFPLHVFHFSNLFLCLIFVICFKPCFHLVSIKTLCLYLAACSFENYVYLSIYSCLQLVLILCSVGFQTNDCPQR